MTGQLERIASPPMIARTAEIQMTRWLPQAHGEYLLLPTEMSSGRHTSQSVSA